MSKLDEKHSDKREQSAADQEDLEFEAWLSQRVLDEAAEMIDELGEDPEMDKLEPTEEGFQQLLKMARAEGLVEEEKKDCKEIKEESEEISELLKAADETDEGRSGENGKVVRHPRFRYKKAVWGVCAAAVLICIFMKPLRSEANRIFLMQKSDELFGNDVNTKISNTDEILESDTSEEEAREAIKNELKLEVPIFYYLPDEMVFDTYEIDKNAHAAYLRYSYQGQFLYLQILENDSKTIGIYRNDQGKLIDTLSSDFVNLDVELWKIEEEGDESSGYLIQWDYKNSYYCFSGKLNEDDIRKLICNIVF